jgi:hypothetical protein
VKAIESMFLGLVLAVPLCWMGAQVAEHGRRKIGSPHEHDWLLPLGRISMGSGGFC